MKRIDTDKLNSNEICINIDCRNSWINISTKEYSLYDTGAKIIELSGNHTYCAFSFIELLTTNGFCSVFFDQQKNKWYLYVSHAH